MDLTELTNVKLVQHWIETTQELISRGEHGPAARLHFKLYDSDAVELAETIAAIYQETSNG